MIRTLLNIKYTNLIKLVMHGWSKFIGGVREIAWETCFHEEWFTVKSFL